MNMYLIRHEGGDSEVNYCQRDDAESASFGETAAEEQGRPRSSSGFDGSVLMGLCGVAGGFWHFETAHVFNDEDELPTATQHSRQ